MPIKSLGADFHKNSTPSSSALRTSLADPGIFSLSLLYKHLTDFAFCLILVLTQSMAVSPPPITTIFLPSALSCPLSNDGTSSPNPFLLEAIKKSKAGTIL